MAKERGFWTDERIARVAGLAANGLYGSDIAADVGCSLHSVLTICGRYAINVNRYNPEQQAYFEQKTREREKRKNDKRRTGPRAPRSEFVFRPGTSKTSPIYRNQFPKLPDMSKDELRAMLAEAFRNTAEARA
jgi:hypothetical protein